MANKAYNSGLERIGNYRWDVDLKDIGVLLVENTYIFDPSHTSLLDVVTHEASGTGYGRRRITFANRSTSSSSDGGSLLVADGTVFWSFIDAGTDLRVILFFSDTNLDNNSNPLLCYYDTGSNIPIDTDGGDVALNFNSLGALRLKNVS